MIETSGHYIDGEFVEPHSGEYFASIDPYENEAWIQIPQGTATDVENAVESANAAVFEGKWAKAGPNDRARYLNQIADAINEKATTLTDREIRETGRPKSEITGMVGALPRWYRYYAGLVDKIQGKTIPTNHDSHVYTDYEPVGVVAAITPWNASVMLATWKLAPALAAGASVVLKPDERASAGVLTLAEAIDETDLPDGAVNIVTGDGETVGQSLITQEDIHKVSFTGGPMTGSRIAKQAGANLKPSVMELGGKSPNVIFPDADLSDAVAGAIDGIYNASGQFCAAGSRVLVHESIHGEVVRRLCEQADRLTLGDPHDEITDMGPLASADQLERVTDHVQRATREGATLVYGGKQPEEDLGSELFFEPTVFTDVEPESSLAQEEVFGPVLAVLQFADEEEAVKIANQTDYGLVAGVWTKNAKRAPRVAKSLRAGTVWINDYRTIGAQYPWGGFDRSGWGRENGVEAVEEFLITKTVFMDYEPG